MMGHKICFRGEIWLIIPKLSLLPLLISSNVYTHKIEINRQTRFKVNTNNSIGKLCLSLSSGSPMQENLNSNYSPFFLFLIFLLGLKIQSSALKTVCFPIA